MRRLDIFCASPASTAICSGMDQRSMVRRGHRPLDLHDHDLVRRKGRLVPNIPCSSQLPIVPKPYRLEKSSSASRKSTTGSADSRRKSSADAYDLARNISRPSHRRPGDSTRYLLRDNHNNTTHEHLIEWLSDPNQSPADTDLVPTLTPRLVRRHRSAKEPSHLLLSENHDSRELVKSSSRSRYNQVVVLRVSLHCKGCEGKVRKHISKMEGVTSFSIEFETKKVTVIGNVTPSGVLASVSRIKNAQLWSSPASSLSSSSSSSTAPTTTLSLWSS